MNAQAMYQALLDGRLDTAQQAVFATRLRDDEGFAADLGAVDADEVLFVTRVLWQRSGGHDTRAPRFDPLKANEAARQGLAERRRRPGGLLAAGVLVLAAAAAVVVLALRPAPVAVAPELAARGATGDVGVAVDWNLDGKPVLSEDSLPAGAHVTAEWTNPKGHFSHLTLGAVDAEGRWHALGSKQPIGAAGVDDPVDPVGPFPLSLPAGTLKLCGVFSKGASAKATAEGVRVCTDDLQLGQ